MNRLWQSVTPHHHGADGGGERRKPAGPRTPSSPCWPGWRPRAPSGIRRDGRARRYFPAVEPGRKAARAETESFLSKVYGGSLGLMVSNLVESRALTAADIAELSAILERAGGDGK